MSGSARSPPGRWAGIGTDAHAARCRAPRGDGAPPRALAGATALASLAVPLLVLATAARPLEVLPLVGALAWLAAPAAIDALLGRQPAVHPLGVDRRDVTTIVVAGREPRHVVRTSVAVAREHGPVVLATLDGREHRRLAAALGAAHVHAPTRDGAVLAALDRVSTPAAVIVRARVAVHGDRVARAAHLLRDRTAWVCGRVAVFNDDAAVPRPRVGTAALARRRARAAGLPVWEEDATVLRLDAAREVLEDRPAPRGELLGALARRGYFGVQVDEELAACEAPSQPGDDADLRVGELQWELREAVALARAPLGARRRLLAWSLALRSLRVVPAALWAAAVLLLAASGPAWPAPRVVAFAAAVAGALRCGWYARGLGREWRPLREVIRFAHDVPSSAVAAWTVLTGRHLRPRTRARSPRIVLWAAATATLLSLGSVAGSRSGAVDPDGLVLLVASLTLLWLVAGRQLTLRRSGRGAFRFPIAVPVTIDGRHDTATLDVSPGGMRLRDQRLRRGEAVHTVLHFGPGVDISVPARVVHCPPGAGVAGLAFEVDDVEAARLAVVLLRAAGVLEAFPAPSAPAWLASGPVPVASAAPRSAGVVAGDRVLVAATVGIGTAALVTLVLLAAGVRPLVVRSGSMEPAIATGDLILTVPVRARAVEPGDVVTFADPTRGGTSVTHRVRAVQRDGDRLVVETRGDANAVSETWASDADATVGRYAARIPAVGRPLLALSSPPVQAGLVAVLGLAIVAGWFPRPGRKQPVASATAGGEHGDG